MGPGGVEGSDDQCVCAVTLHLPKDTISVLFCILYFLLSLFAGDPFVEGDKPGGITPSSAMMAAPPLTRRIDIETGMAPEVKWTKESKLFS